MAILDKNHNNYIEGNLIVATSLISKDSIFAKSVIYIVSHTAEGTLGIIINQPITKIETSVIFSDIENDLNKYKESIMLYLGGPIESAKGFVLHSSDYKKDVLLTTKQNISLSSNIEILKDIASGFGPEKMMLTLGYSSWATGQLEDELKNNNWIIVPYSEQIVFSEDQNKWQSAYESLGINHSFYSSSVGNA